MFYYWAANIQKILSWWYESELDWCKMESLSCHTSSLVANFILLGPLCYDHTFLPSKLDSAFTLWKKKGITSFRDLFLNGTFVDFKSLSDKHGLPQSNFFCYLQVHSFVKNHCSTFPSLSADLPTILDRPGQN